MAMKVLRPCCGQEGRRDRGAEETAQARAGRLRSYLSPVARPVRLESRGRQRLKDLEGENAALERLLANAELDKDALREIAQGNF